MPYPALLNKIIVLFYRALTKAINKSNEQKLAAKVLQGGGFMTSSDLMKKGKELSKELRRKQVKKKLTRVEEKLAELKKKDEDAV